MPVVNANDSHLSRAVKVIPCCEKCITILRSRESQPISESYF